MNMIHVCAIFVNNMHVKCINGISAAHVTIWEVCAYDMCPCDMDVNVVLYM